MSFRDLRDALREFDSEIDDKALFINHTLWNRDCDHIYFFARAGWNGNGGKRINVPVSIHADGTALHRARRSSPAGAQAARTRWL